MTHHDNPAHYGLRTDKYKLIFFYGLPLDAKGAVQKPTPAYWELYDLEKDPHEMNNVYADPAYATVVKELESRIAAVEGASRRHGRALSRVDEGTQRNLGLISSRRFLPSSRVVAA